MNCPNCGTSNLDNAAICVNCGRPLSGAAPAQGSYAPPVAPPAQPVGSFATPQAPVGPAIPNYLVQSILITLCCCLPLGIVAIIFSAQVNSKLAAGDIAGARDASQKAKMFVWIGFAIGIVCIALGLVLNGAAFLAAIRNAR